MRVPETGTGRRRSAQPRAEGISYRKCRAGRVVHYRDTAAIGQAAGLIEGDVPVLKHVVNTIPAADDRFVVVKRPISEAKPRGKIIVVAKNQGLPGQIRLIRRNNEILIGVENKGIRHSFCYDPIARDHNLALLRAKDAPQVLLL